MATANSLATVQCKKYNRTNPNPDLSYMERQD